MAVINPYLYTVGRQQAQYCAKRLKELDLPISKIYYSTMTRATETGLIISKYFPGKCLLHKVVGIWLKFQA
mgnify:FL=1